MKTSETFQGVGDKQYNAAPNNGTQKILNSDKIHDYIIKRKKMT